MNIFLWIILIAGAGTLLALWTGPLIALTISRHRGRDIDEHAWLAAWVWFLVPLSLAAVKITGG